MQTQITQMVQPACARPECRRHDTLDETAVVQHIEMPIDSGMLLPVARARSSARWNG